jgi:hypothetical protein
MAAGVSSGMDELNPIPARPPHAGQIAVGMAVLAMGLLLLADRYVQPDVPLMRSWWPLVLIVLGASRAACARSSRDGDLRSGTWFVMIGIWALASERHLFGLTFGTSWPLLLIGSGVMMVWRALEPRGRTLRGASRP